MCFGRSRPTFYSLGRPAPVRSWRRLTTRAKIFQPGNKGEKEEEGDERSWLVSGWTGRLGGFEPLGRIRTGANGTRAGDVREKQEPHPEKGPFDSDDIDIDFDEMANMFTKSSDMSRDEKEMLDEAKLEAVVEDDWPRLTAEALAGAWREWRRFVLTRMGIYALWLSGILFASTGLSYYIGRHFVNKALPWMSATVSQAANRPIRIGRCKGLWPAGLLGCGSFLDVGPLVIGPAEAERSIVEVAKVKLSLRPIASLLQFKIVVAAHLEGVQATLRQGDNGSWFGYPEDTKPLSARPTISVPRRSGMGGTMSADSEDGSSSAQLVLESVRVVNGTASLHLAGDPDPRLLKRMNGTVTISNRGRLELDIAGNPVSRGVAPSDRPATMKSDTLPRHLRAEQTDAEKRSFAREAARGTDGGHIRCFLSLDPKSNSANSKGNGKVKGKSKAASAREFNDLKVRIQLNNASAAVVERTIPGLPIDVSTGRVDGELRLRCNSQESWAFPEFGGQIRCRGLSFHFWDATDNFADTDVDLLFEGRRMYLHGGKGYYGAVPIAASGDMDLFPGEKNMRELKDMRDKQGPRPTVVQPGSGHIGEYRISAQIPGVDVHALRETLGVRPPPRPIAGAVRGFLYVGGPLDFPIFTGSAETISPQVEDLKRGVPGTESALAEDAVRAGATEGAVAAYDCFAVKDARAVFTVDTWAQKLTLHEAEASPVAGGEARASGYIGIDPGALSDPQALQVELEADGFDPRSVVASYALKGAATAFPTAEHGTILSNDSGDESSTPSEEANAGWVGSLPDGLQIGLRHFISSGGPLGAIIEQSSYGQVGEGNVSQLLGTAAASKLQGKFGPPFGLPPALYDKIVPATPGTATATITGPHAAPVVDAQWEVKDAAMSGNLRITRQRIAADIRAPALELSGSVDTSYPPLEVALAARTIEDSIAAGSPSFTAAEAHAKFRSLDLAALVVSEDDLARLAPPDRLRLRLTGGMKVKGSVEGAGGATADSLPKVTPASMETARLAALQFAANGIETTPKSPYIPSADGAHDPRFSGEVSLEGIRVNQLQLAPRLAGEVEASVQGASMNARGRADEHLRFQLDIPAASSASATTSISTSTSTPVNTPSDGARNHGVESPAPAVSVSIRRGLLRAEFGASDGRGDVEVAGLRLDDLELASLRGRVERAKLSVDLRARKGVATLRVQQPRLSGVQGEVLDADASWDGRIVRLERAALDQRRSRYTLEGEHCLDDALWESLPPPRPEPVIISSLPEEVVKEGQDDAQIEISASAAASERAAGAVAVLDADDGIKEGVSADVVTIDPVAVTVHQSNNNVDDSEWVVVKQEDVDETRVDVTDVQEQEADIDVEVHALSDSDSDDDGEVDANVDAVQEDTENGNATSDNYAVAEKKEDGGQEEADFECSSLESEGKVSPLRRIQGFFSSFEKPEAVISNQNADVQSTVGVATEILPDGPGDVARTSSIDIPPHRAVELDDDASNTGGDETERELVVDVSKLDSLPGANFEEVGEETALANNTSVRIDVGDIAMTAVSDEIIASSMEDDKTRQEVQVSEAKYNPLAGVVDRLTDIATKVTEGAVNFSNLSAEAPTVAVPVENAEADVTAEDLHVEDHSTAPVEMDPGAWRLLLAVPQADVEEMLPAVRLAAALREGATPLEYTRAKEHFLHAVRRIAIKASEELGRQLEEAAAAAAAEQRSSGSSARLKGIKGAGADTDSRGPDGDAPVQLPGIQDLRGVWRGTVEVKGGSDNGSLPSTPVSQVSSVEFDVAGDGWQWGQYRMQSLQAQGNVDTKEGLHLRRLELLSDGAVFKVDGHLICEAQDAAFAIIDMQAHRLAPIIHHITSAASATAGAPPPPPPPLPPIAGTLFVSGDVGGSFSRPTGHVRAHLSEGRIGTVRMGHANASAEITPARTARFAAEANPASSKKRGTQIIPGHLRLSGVLPLPDAVDRSVAVDWSVQDGGMQLISALSAPSLGTGGPVEWQAGGADITLAVRGTLADPIYDGSAVITRAKIVSPLLARPLYPVNANVRIQRNTLYADHFDAKCGPRGSVKVRGAVPVLQPRRGAGSDTWEGLVARADVQGGIRAEATGLDVRARAAYSGRLDADLVVKGTLLEPEVGGSLRLSKGTAFIQPNAAPNAAAGGSDDSVGAASSSRLGFINREREARRGLAGFLQRSTPPGSPSSKGGSKGAEATSLEQLPLRFRGLRLIVGPELSAVYPFVLNFGVSGEVVVNGAADPILIRPSGAISFERGDINLVATQVRLNREHPNRALFVPEHGLDPTLDVSLVGADISALVQGKASNWTDNLVITSRSSRSGASTLKPGVVGGGGKVVGGVGTGDQIVGPSDRDAAVAEAARIVEGQLAESLLEQDGQLAFSNLAASTVATLMPKIETGGQLGNARWRVTTAPSIPGLLSLDPGTDPFRNISQFTLGSDWELMLGDSLQATMSRKLKESEMQTKFALVYKLTDKLRMQLNSESSTATRLLFEFTTNTTTNSRTGGGSS